jgi:hypothetical protein
MVVKLIEDQDPYSEIESSNDEGGASAKPRRNASTARVRSKTASASTGAKGKGKSKEIVSEDDEATTPPKPKRVPKAKRKGTTQPATVTDDDVNMDVDTVSTPAVVRPKPKAKQSAIKAGKSTKPARNNEDANREDVTVPTPAAVKPKPKRKTAEKASRLSKATVSTEDEDNAPLPNLFDGALPPLPSDHDDVPPPSPPASPPADDIDSLPPHPPRPSPTRLVRKRAAATGVSPTQVKRTRSEQSVHYPASERDFALDHWVAPVSTSISLLVHVVLNDGWNVPDSPTTKPLL